VASLNFEHLRSTWPQLTELGGMAEQHLHTDPQTAVAKMRVGPDGADLGVMSKSYKISPVS
jgi:hypothetical protein